MAGITQREYMPAIALEVDGVGTIYHSGTIPFDFASVGKLSASRGVSSWSGTHSRLDVIAGSVEPSRMSVQLALTEATRPLLRKLPFGAGAHATLAQSLDSVSVSPIVCTAPIAGFPPAGYLWVGLECIEYTSIVGDEFRGITRGALGTWARPHVGSPYDTALAERVYQHCGSWLRRPARVWVADVRSGAWVSPVCAIDGFISGVPQLTAQGFIEVELSSISSALDVPFGDEGASCGLQSGYHVFSDTFTGAALSPRFSARIDQVAVPLSALGPGPNDVTLEDTLGAQLYAFFSHNGGDGTAPVYCDLARVGPEYVTPVSITKAGTVVTLTLESLSWAGTVIGSYAVLWGCTTISQGTAVGSSCRRWDGTVVLPWPSEVFRRWGDSFLNRLKINAYPEFIDGPTVRVGEPSGGLPSGLYLTHSARDEYICAGLVMGEGGEVAQLEDGLTLHHPDSSAVAPSQYTWPATASAWAQEGESWVLLDSPLFMGTYSPGVSRNIIIEQGDRRYIGEVVDCVSANVLNISATDYPGFELGVPVPVHGWAVRLAEPLTATFVDGPGAERVEVRELASFQSVSPGRVLLRLLLSVEGDGTNTVHDVLPWGAGLPLTAVDRRAISSIDGTAIGPITATIEAGASVRELVQGILKPLGLVLVEAITASGRWRISVRKMRTPSATEVQQSINDGAWLVSQRPVTQTDERTVNRLIYNGNLGILDESTVRIMVTDGDSTAAGLMGLDEVDVVGARFGGTSDSVREHLLPLALERIRALAYPRIQLTGSIAYADSMMLSAGMIVAVAATDCVSYDGMNIKRPVPAMVVAIERDSLSARSVITLDIYGDVGAGWAPSARVDGAPVGNILPIALDFYSDGVSGAGEPVTDASYFEPGDAVTLFDPGDMSGALSTSIVASSPTSIEVANAGAAADGWVLIHAPLDGATRETLKPFAFLGAAGYLLSEPSTRFV